MKGRRGGLLPMDSIVRPNGGVMNTYNEFRDQSSGVAPKMLITGEL